MLDDRWADEVGVDRARQLGTVSRRQIDLACRSFAHSPAHAIIQKGSRSVHFSQDKSRTKLRQVKTKTGNFPHFCPQFPELEPNAEKCAPKPAACTSRWEPPHLCGGRSASALREKLDFNQCALAPESRNPRAKAHFKIKRFSAGLKSSFPLLKQGAPTKSLPQTFSAVCEGVLHSSPIHQMRNCYRVSSLRLRVPASVAAPSLREILRP